MRTIWAVPVAALALSGCVSFTDQIAGDRFVETPHSERCSAVVTAVADTDWQVNDHPMERLTLEVTPPAVFAPMRHDEFTDILEARRHTAGPAPATPQSFESTVSVVVSWHANVQPGDAFDVSCDPDDPKATKVID